LSTNLREKMLEIMVELMVLNWNQLLS